MYLKKKNKFFHGLMFHHFHDLKKHLKTQGSITGKQFAKIINYVGKKNILEPKEFIERMKNKNLKKNHLCITFDDNLRCQYDIALPILKRFNLKAFFFVYTSSFSNKADLLEAYKYFRHKYYKNVNSFYSEFNDILIQKYNKKKN